MLGAVKDISYAMGCPGHLCQVTLLQLVMTRRAESSGCVVRPPDTGTAWAQCCAHLTQVYPVAQFCAQTLLSHKQCSLISYAVLMCAGLALHTGASSDLRVQAGDPCRALPSLDLCVCAPVHGHSHSSRVSPSSTILGSRSSPEAAEMG